MKLSRQIWAVPALALVIAACAPEDEETTQTGGTTTTEEGVEIALGTGSGNSFNEGVMSATIGSSSLSAGGETTISVNVVNVSASNAIYSGSPITIAFTSACAESGKASFSQNEIVTSSGSVQTVYRAEGCYGNDTITAKVEEATASVRISVAPAEVNSIGFSGLSASSISYTNSSTPAQANISEVSFKLLDAKGFPVEGREVSFSLSSNSDDHDVTLSNSTATSDSSGLVTTRVNAGMSPANIRVVATYTSDSGDTVATQSLAIAVNTGLPDSTSFSLSVGGASVATAYDVDGVSTSITVRAADHFNNPVADGTTVSFWAEFGDIDPTCDTEDGTCSVEWTSGGNRPNDGLATIVAYTVGEDTFLDTGSLDGVFDTTDTFITTSEVFFDRNIDGTTYNGSSYTDAGTGETVASDVYIDYDNSGTYNATSSRYRGSRCSATAIAAGHCAQSTIHVWDRSQLALNTLTPQATFSATTWNAGNSYTISVTDSLGNYPPVGTTVTVAAVGNAVADIDVTGEVPSTGFSDANPYVFRAYVNSVTTGGTFKVTVTMTGGISVIYYVTVA